MRTVNFRVFDPVTKEMYYVGEDGVSIVFGSAGWRLYVEGNPVTIEDEGELMMFTGLHDRHEFPIFEGDIVEVGHRTIEVKFGTQDYEEDFGGIFRYMGFNIEIGSGYPEPVINKLEVIGNVHQHSHLIKG